MADSKISTANVKGASGEQYPFEVYSLETFFRQDLGGIYLIARRYKNAEGNFSLDPIFIGEMDDLSRLFGYHRKQKCFEQFYPNCKCIYLVKDPERRKVIVDDLIEELAPHCND